MFGLVLFLALSFPSISSAAHLVDTDVLNVGGVEGDILDFLGIPHTDIGLGDFALAGIATFSSYKVIVIGDDLGTDPGNAAAIGGAVGIFSGGRIFLSTHDAFGHVPQEGPKRLIANAIQWVGHGPQTGLVVFMDEMNEPELGAEPNAFDWAPAEWDLTALGEFPSGFDDIDILEPFDPALPAPSSPIYDGSLGGPASGPLDDSVPDCSDFDLSGITSVNWCNSHHDVWNSYDSSIFTLSEVSTIFFDDDPQNDEVVSLVRFGATQDQVIPEPATFLLLASGLLSSFFRTKILHLFTPRECKPVYTPGV